MSCFVVVAVGGLSLVAPSLIVPSVAVSSFMLMSAFLVAFFLLAALFVPAIVEFKFGIQLSSSDVFKSLRSPDTATGRLMVSCALQCTVSVAQA